MKHKTVTLHSQASAQMLCQIIKCIYLFCHDTCAASNPVLQLNPVELESQAAALTQQVDVFVEGDQISNGAPEGLVVSDLVPRQCSHKCTSIPYTAGSIHMHSHVRYC